jgi:hypothetical protein
LLPGRRTALPANWPVRGAFLQRDLRFSRAVAVKANST